jgi:hypothetical protein
MVTSSIRTALFVQSGGEVTAGVFPGGVPFSGVFVAGTRSDFVGGNVEVTKSGTGEGSCVTGEIEIQAASRKPFNMVSVQNFFMARLYCEMCVSAPWNPIDLRKDSFF